MQNVIVEFETHGIKMYRNNKSKDKRRKLNYIIMLLTLHVKVYDFEDCSKFLHAC